MVKDLLRLLTEQKTLSEAALALGTTEPILQSMLVSLQRGGYVECHLASLAPGQSCRQADGEQKATRTAGCTHCSWRSFCYSPELMAQHADSKVEPNSSAGKALSWSLTSKGLAALGAEPGLPA